MDPLITERLRLVPQTRDTLLAQIEAMPPEHRSQVSLAWLEKVQACASVDPWFLGFQIRLRSGGDPIGQCGFTGPPDSDGLAEIAYRIEPEEQGKGHATEAAGALVKFAMSDTRVRGLYAHTLASNPASGRVLTKCGFHCLGEVDHPEDGRVLRWEWLRGELSRDKPRRLMV